MTDYQLKITGVHYGANGDSVAGQKDTEEMHMRTRELLSWIDRERPMVVLSADPTNHIHKDAIMARAQGRRIGRVAFDDSDRAWDLLRQSGKPMLLAKVKEVAVRNHGYAVVTVSADELQETQAPMVQVPEWGLWLSDLPLLPPSEQLQAEEEAAFVLENVFFPNRVTRCQARCYVMILSPNYHRIVHKANPHFNRKTSAYQYLWCCNAHSP